VKRFADRLLAGLAVGVALAALVRRGGNRPGKGEAVEWTPGHELPPEPAPERGISRWRFLFNELTSRFRAHHTGIVSGSLAYYAMLALVPSLVATVAIYGLATNAADLESQITTITDTLPPAAAGIVTDQLREIVTANEAGLGLTAALSLLLALWSASAGTKALVSGINLAYGLPETRNFFRLRGMALLITIGGVLFAAVIAWFISLVTIDAGSVLQEGLFAVGVLGALTMSLGVLYKLAPNRPTVIGKLASAGAVAATLLLVITTTGFTLYVSNFGSFNATYGALAGVVLLLLWFYISGFVVLMGAELNAELEQLRKRRSRHAA
jgi:membrane protein